MVTNRVALLGFPIACALFASLWAPAPAHAQAKRVVVEAFRGPTAGRVRSQLVANLERQDGIELVAQDEVRRAARELGIRGSSYADEDYVQIARALNVAAFVDGRTSRRRRAWAVSVRVRNGADGTVVGSESWGGRTIGALSAIRRNGYARLSSHLDLTLSPSAPPPTPAPVATGVTATGGTPWYAAGTEDEAPPTGDDDDEEERGFGPRASGRADALRLFVLGGSLRRSMNAMACVMSTPARSGGQPCSAAGDVFEERRYNSQGLGHMEIGVGAELYPGAFGRSQAVPWFGLVVDYRHSVLLNSFGYRPSGEQIEVPTSQEELYLGLRGRYLFGDDPSGFEGTVDIGYGAFSFELDPAVLKELERSAVLPPLTYRYLMLGAGISYGLVPVYLRAGIEASWRLGLGIGDQAREIWGTQTTDTSGWSLALKVRTEAPYVADGLFAEVTAEWFRFTTTYRGQTACVDASFAAPADDCNDDDPWEPWPHQPGNYDAVTGGIPDPVDDDYFRLGVSLGYAFR